MKIYTKTGDKGETSLIGGKRVSKHHIRIEAYGTIDELIAFVGLLRDNVADKKVHDFLLHSQENLMVCAAILATDHYDGDSQVPILHKEDILAIENEIDTMEKNLEPLNSFIIPGGHTVVSFCHIARTVCRRAERLITKIAEEDMVPEIIIEYINRYSDYLFVLSRKLSIDYKAIEHPWTPNL